MQSRLSLHLTKNSPLSDQTRSLDSKVILLPVCVEQTIRSPLLGAVVKCFSLRATFETDRQEAGGVPDGRCSKRHISCNVRHIIHWTWRWLLLSLNKITHGTCSHSDDEPGNQMFSIRLSTVSMITVCVSAEVTCMQWMKASEVAKVMDTGNLHSLWLAAKSVCVCYVCRMCLVVGH